MSFLVKRVHEIDEELIRLLWQRAGMNVSSVNPSFFDKQDNILLVAYCVKEACGFLYGYLLDSPAHVERQVFLYSIDVFPQFRRQGVATSLISALKELACNEGCKEIFVLTNQTNQAAMAMYAKNGGRRENDDDVMFVYQL